MMIAWLLASCLSGAVAFTSTRAFAPDAPPAAPARSRRAGAALLNMEGPGMGMGMGGGMGMYDGMGGMYDGMGGRYGPRQTYGTLDSNWFAAKYRVGAGVGAPWDWFAAV